MVILSDSWKITNDNNNITMTKDDVIVDMDQCIKTQDSWVCGVEILPSNMKYMAFDSSVKCKH